MEGFGWATRGGWAGEAHSLGARAASHLPRRVATSRSRKSQAAKAHAIEATSAGAQVSSSFCGASFAMALKREGAACEVRANDHVSIDASLNVSCASSRDQSLSMALKSDGAQKPAEANPWASRATARGSSTSRRFK